MTPITADRRLALVLLTVMCTCAMLVPILAAWLIPDRTLDKIIALPWTVIIPILSPAVLAGVAAVWGFFTGSLTPGKPVDLSAPVLPPLEDDAPTNPIGRPRRVPPAREGFALMDAMLVVLAAACIASLLHGCGGSPAIRDAYARETARCTANEAAIVARADTTFEEDREAMLVERARCDAARHAIATGGEQ